MTNYIPADKEVRFQLEKINPLYREIFDRRAEGRCDECDDLGHNRLCLNCAHNSETDISYLSISEVSSITEIRKTKKFSKRPKILKTLLGNSKCPCCDSSKGWTRTLIAYFSSDAELKLGQCVASYCPICGKNVEE